MASYPVVNFNSDTDYAAVEVLLLEMFSDLNAQTGCCGSKSVMDAFNKAMPSLINLPYDKINNVQRWQSDIESAYKLLQPFASAGINIVTGFPYTFPITLT